MRAHILSLTALALASCTTETDLGVRTGALSAMPPVRFSEIHYDNTGTDTGEAIEISGPAGMDVTGWTVVLYNGNGGVTYNTATLSGTIPATCGTRGVMVLTYPSNGVQNGGTGSVTTGNPADSDGMALVNASGQIVEFLSYEGVLTAANGPALGRTSVDIVARENGADPVGFTLKRDGNDAWGIPSAGSFGACNDVEPPPPAEVATVGVEPTSATVTVGGATQLVATARDADGNPIANVAFNWTTSDATVATVSSSGVVTGVAPGDATITAAAPNGISADAAVHVEEAPPPPPPDVFISELHYDNSGPDVGEAVEIEGPAGRDVNGWRIVLYNGNGGVAYSTRVLAGAIPNNCGDHGTIVTTYPADGIQNGSPDGVALVDAAGNVVEFLSYEGAFVANDGPAAGRLSVDIGESQSNAGLGLSLQRNGDQWYLRFSSFNDCNLDDPPPPPHISITGRTQSDPALPIGFQDQLFPTLLDARNQPVETTFTWSSETPATASVDERGVITALDAGTMTLRATAADGTTSTISLPARLAVGSDSAVYGHNTEFGDPADGDDSNEIILRHDEYTSAWDPARGTPVWVAYDINITHFGPEDRCDCFTFDPALPPELPRYTTADYTGAAAFHGFGIDRGHLARSFDRTSGALDNAYTFYFSNIVPQASDLNQGPWSVLEMHLGDLARFQDKEVYVVAGVTGSRGTLKGEGKIVIPARMWKVAVIMPRGRGLGDVVDPSSVEVIAVDMPNEAGVRNVPWQTYLTTVDAVEAASGFDLLGALPDPIERVVERGGAFQPPTAATDGPYATDEGGSVSVSGAASTGSVVSYQWDFGDGTGGSGPSLSHTYAQDGVYTVHLVVTDADGFVAETASSATVANVAPAIAAFPGATLLPGEVYTAAGSFADPGADAWTAGAEYGDGGAAEPVSLAGQSFLLVHTYGTAGVFEVRVAITDDDTTSTATTTVTVITRDEGARQAIALVDGLVAAGKLAGNEGKTLRVKLVSAEKNLREGKLAEARSPLASAIVQLDAFVARGSLSAADAAPLRALISRVLASIP